MCVYHHVVAGSLGDNTQMVDQIDGGDTVGDWGNGKSRQRASSRHVSETDDKSNWGTGFCYSSSLLSWYLSLFRLTSHLSALWYVFLRLDTYSDSFEFFELFFY